MRFYGAVGYANLSETAPGTWTEIITEVSYYGDVLQNSRGLEQPQETLNTDISLQNSFNILGDAYAYENFAKMRYVSWNGSNWEVTAVRVQRPRLFLTIGGLWNGDTS